MNPGLVVGLVSTVLDGGWLLQQLGAAVAAGVWMGLRLEELQRGNVG